MTRFDRLSSLFWIGMALLICLESIRIGPGSFLNPGPGFVPLGSGLLIGIFGTTVFISTFKRSEGGKEVFWKPDAQVGKVITTVVSILGYAFLIDTLGFHLVTLFWIGYVCWRIGEMRWKGAVFTSFVTTFLSYLLFELGLGIHFSKGVLGF